MAVPFPLCWGSFFPVWFSCVALVFHCVALSLFPCGYLFFLVAFDSTTAICLHHVAADFRESFLMILIELCYYSDSHLCPKYR